MKIDYNNMPVCVSKSKFAMLYIANCIRTWILFHFKWPWIKYSGFVRVMKRVGFARFDIEIGDHVQFGNDCKIVTNVHFGNYVLMASRVCFVGKYDHSFNNPGVAIWNGKRGNNGITYVDDDVWLGHNVTVVGPVRIGRGSIVAGAVVSKNIPECEIWGGVPAKKIGDRFATLEEKKMHLDFLDSLRG